MPESVDAQVLEAMLVANESVLGNAPTNSQSVTLEASAYSISLLMLNAVSTQYSASQIANASVASTCAEIIKAGA
jgi:hypothetical protein